MGWEEGLGVKKAKQDTEIMEFTPSASAHLPQSVTAESDLKTQSIPIYCLELWIRLYWEKLSPQIIRAKKESN